MKPFPFEKIPKISNADSREEGMKILLRKFRSRSDFFAAFRRVIQETLSRELSPAFSCRAVKPAWVPFAGRLQDLSSQGVYLTFTLAPDAHKAVLELDPLIAQAAIDKLLGGSGDVLPSDRGPTEIEEGVLTFLFLKLFSSVFEAKSLQSDGGPPTMHFRMQGLFFSQDALVPAVNASEGEEALQVPVKVSMGSRSGYARLFLPQAMVEAMVSEVPEEHEAAESESLSPDSHPLGLQRFGFLQTSLWSELGRVPLSVSDINALEVGDVVVLEETGAHVQSGRLAGQLSLRVGQGDHGGFSAEIVPDHASLKVKILKLERESLI